MLSKFRNIAHKRLKQLGWVLSRTKSIEEEKRRRIRYEQVSIWDFAKHQNFKTILDIGANEGQFVKLIRNHCKESMIYSFEPLKECYDKLKVNIDTQQPSMAFHFALGAKEETMKINRNESSPSSSILSMDELHKKELPHTTNTDTEEITVKSLDQIASDLKIEQPLLIKIDVQGFEDQVIRGGENTIKEASIVVVELSFEELYEGQPLFDDIYSIMKTMGFKYRGNIDQWKSKSSGKILQADGFFENLNLKTS